MPRINLSGTAEGFEPMPKGVYPAQLDEWEYIPEAASSGEPFIKCTFVINEGEFEGRKQWKNLSLQEQSLWNLKRSLIRMGAPRKTIDDPTGFEIEELMPDLIGSECRLRVDTKTYEGELRNEVKEILTAESVVV